MRVAALLAVVLAMLTVAAQVKQVVAAEQLLTWEHVTIAAGSPAPSPRSFAAAGYDRLRDRLLVFGGSSHVSLQAFIVSFQCTGKDGSGSVLSDTWMLWMSNHTWVQVSSATAPAARFSMVAGVDQTGGRNRFIVSMGEGASRAFFNDVWALDLVSLQWTQLTTTGTPPISRYGSGGGINVFDSSKLLVSHGFGTGSVRYQDSFSLDLVTLQWTSTTPHTGPLPSNRCLVGSTVTPSNDIFMYGGCGSGGWGPCPDASAWILGSSTWTETPNPCVGPRTNSAAAPLPGATATVLIFGGNGWSYGDGPTGAVTLWSSSGTGLTVTPHAASSVRRNVEWFGRLIVCLLQALPPIRQSPSFILAPVGTTPSVNDVVYLFGGAAPGGSTLNDVWRLSGSGTTGLPLAECETYVDLRIVHGSLMFIAWGVLLPLGVTVARFCRLRRPGWFYCHRTTQCVGVLVSITGFVIAILMVGTGHFLAVPHSWIGLFVVAVGLQQPINAFFRPEPPENKTRRRVCWEIWHKYSGRVAVILGLTNPFWGLKALHSPNTDLLITLYSIWVAALGAFWLAATLLGHPGAENPSRLATTVGFDVPALKPTEHAIFGSPPDKQPLQEEEEEQ